MLPSASRKTTRCIRKKRRLDARAQRTKIHSIFMLPRTQAHSKNQMLDHARRTPSPASRAGRPQNGIRLWAQPDARHLHCHRRAVDQHDLMAVAKNTRRAQAILLSVTSNQSSFSRHTQFRLRRCSADRSSFPASLCCCRRLGGRSPFLVPQSFLLSHRIPRQGRAGPCSPGHQRLRSP